MLTPEQIQAIAKTRGDTIVNPNPNDSSQKSSSSNAADEFAKLVGYTPPAKSAIDPTRSLPGAETAVTPAKPASPDNMGFNDTFKSIPNALGDVWGLIKEGTYGTAKKVVNDIPVAAYNLIKEQGIGAAIKNTATSVPSAIKNTVESLIPQSAKELANTDAIGDIPEQFKALVKENGGSYSKSLLAAIKAIPGALPDAVQNYADQIDRARQSVENHPVNEFLGWLGLKALGESEGSPLKAKEEFQKPLQESSDAIKEKITELPGATIPGKIARRVQDAKMSGDDLKQQPKPVQTAVKADIPQPQATLIHEATPTEKSLMSEMLDKHTEGTKKLVMTPETRPDAVIGREAMKAVKFLEDQKKSAQLIEGEHVKNLGNHDVNYSIPANNFFTKLQQLKVRVRTPEELLTEKGKVGPLDFSKSELDGRSSAKDRGLLEMTFDKLKPNENGEYIKPADELHTNRQSLFNETQNKNFTEPFSDKIVNIVHNDQGNSVRSDLLHAIRDQAGDTGKGYEATTVKNAKIQDALQSFYKLIGKDAGTRETNIKNLGVGEVANRLEGNASAKVENAFQKIEDIASQYGFKNDVSIRKLVAFKTILKNILGETQHNSLAGAVEQGSRAALPGEAMDVAGNALSGKVGGTIKAVGKFVKSNTRAEQARALKNLLEGTKNNDIKQVENSEKEESNKRSKEEKKSINEEEPF